MVFYESPYRLLKTLTLMSDTFGPDRPACVSREISKVFEEHLHGTLATLTAHFTETAPRGEIVITVGGNLQKQKKHNNVKQI